MNPLLLSFISKLPSNNAPLPLNPQSPKVATTYSYLSTIIPSSPSLLPLSYILQNIPLAPFTTQEITAVAALDFSQLEVTTLTTPPKTLKENQPLFDTGSGRIYRLINPTTLIPNLLNRKFYALQSINSYVLQELIIFLAVGGH